LFFTGSYEACKATDAASSSPASCRTGQVSVVLSREGPAFIYRPAFARFFFFDHLYLAIEHRQIGIAYICIYLTSILLSSLFVMSFYQPNPDAIKGPDPLTDNWTYDSAINLFSWNPMMPDPFTFDLPDDLMNFESKDMSAGMVAPSDISGFAIGNHLGEDTASISVRSILSSFSSYTS
jgi:hypothetical protein